MATIGIDLDGVCYDFTAAFADLVGFDRPKAEGWEFYEEWGWTREEFLESCRKGVESSTLFGYGYPIAGAKEGIQALLDAGHKVIFVTARGGFGGGYEIREKVHGRTRYWLTSTLGVNNPQIVFDGRKHKVARKLGIDVFLDDKPNNVRQLHQAGVRSFLFDQPWNQDFITPNRVHTWDEFVERVAVADWEKLVEAPIQTTEEVRVTSPTGGQKGTKPARFDLIPPAIWQVAELYGKGAEKYDDWNWRKGYDWSLSYAAMMRHAWLFWGGEDIDPETGLPHLTSVVFHALTLLTFMTEQRQFDDRYTTADVLSEHIAETEEDAA